MFFVTVLQKQKVYIAVSPFSQFLTEQFQALSEFRRVCILAKRIVSASLFCLSKTLALSSHSSSGCLYRTRTCSQRSSGWSKNFNTGIALVLFNSIPFRMTTRNPLWGTFPPPHLVVSKVYCGSDGWAYQAFVFAVLRTSLALLLLCCVGDHGEGSRCRFLRRMVLLAEDLMLSF